MFVAAFIVQLPDALFEVPPNAIKAFVVLRGIETPLAMFAICCALVLTGGGRFSLDAVLRRERLAAKRKRRPKPPLSRRESRSSRYWRDRRGRAARPSGPRR